NQKVGGASRGQRGARAGQDGVHHAEKRRGAAMKSKIRWSLGVAVALVLGFASPARAGTYLDAAALLLDETRRSSSFVQSHLADRVDLDHFDELRKLLDLAFVAKLLEQSSGRVLELRTDEHLPDGDCFLFDGSTNGRRASAPPDDRVTFALGDRLGNELPIF